MILFAFINYADHFGAIVILSPLSLVIILIYDELTQSFALEIASMQVYQSIFLLNSVER